jgi:predicted O-methyltransferase YrrM
MQTRDQTLSLQYITRELVAEPAACAAIKAEGERRRPGMQLSAYEGRVLQWLVQISTAKHILEVGTFMGYSTCWMAEALPEDGRITTLEYDASHAAQARTHLAHYPAVTVEEGDGLAWIKHYSGPAFDFMFIDAQKKSYMEYLDAALPHLCTGAWVVADNSLLFGNLAGEPDADRASASAKDVMAALNKRLTHGTEFNGLLLPTPEGMTVGIRI